MQSQFLIERPIFDAANATARFSYGLDGRHFIEVLEFPAIAEPAALTSPAFLKLLDLTAIVLGVSYFKLKAPLEICAPNIALTQSETAFVLDVYENGLGEFYARNNLSRFGKLVVSTPHDVTTSADRKLELPNRALLPIGGGKDSLVSVELLSAAAIPFTPFAVNPKGPILTSVDKIGVPPVYVRRILDKEMIRLGKEPGFYNGHVPSTAINSMIASLCALLFGFNRIVLSNERSASEGNVVFDGREANHQYSKSLGFERTIATILAEATGGALEYFSLLRPYSEARIAALFARETRYDRVFSSCNQNFKLAGHDGPLWCGHCPKCHFVFLIFAPVMDKARLLSIFGQNLLDNSENEASFRELTGLAGQKPWECVGEILEAAACLYALAERPEWSGDTIVARLKPDLEAQYGAPALAAALDDLMADSPDHLIPAPVLAAVSPHAV
ncbi:MULTISPECIES: endonuclease domain-containing protein [unclassified Devosia]|uniref:endonuclease domain-containing protein n=1 Tax=unclassified Devosia TaxID=196773 RepID=UPI001557608C|nr:MULTISPECIES: endonuclease domain-containing protein [unclassified Devosia]